MGKIITIASGKGGMGKTTLTAELATALSRNGRRVIAVDTDSALRNLDMLLGVQDRVVYNLYDAVSGACAFEDVPVACTPGGELSYLAVSGSDFGAPTLSENNFKIALAALARDYDAVLVDCAAGASALTRVALTVCDTALLLPAPDLLAIRDCEKVARFFTRYNPLADGYLVVNRVEPRAIEQGLAPDIDTIMDTVGLPLIALLPLDMNVPLLQNNVRRILGTGSPVAPQIEDLVRRLEGEQVALKKFW